MDCLSLINKNKKIFVVVDSLIHSGCQLYGSSVHRLLFDGNLNNLTFYIPTENVKNIESVHDFLNLIQQCEGNKIFKAKYSKDKTNFVWEFILDSERFKAQFFNKLNDILPEKTRSNVDLIISSNGVTTRSTGSSFDTLMTFRRMIMNDVDHDTNNIQLINMLKWANHFIVDKCTIYGSFPCRMMMASVEDIINRDIDIMCPQACDVNHKILSLQQKNDILPELHGRIDDAIDTLASITQELSKIKKMDNIKEIIKSFDTVDDLLDDIGRHLKFKNATEYGHGKIKLDNVDIDLHKFCDVGDIKPDAFYNNLKMNASHLTINGKIDGLNFVETLFMVLSDVINKNYTLIKPVEKQFSKRINRLIIKPLVMEHEGFCVSYDYLQNRGIETFVPKLFKYGTCAKCDQINTLDNGILITKIDGKFICVDCIKIS